VHQPSDIVSIIRIKLAQIDPKANWQIKGPVIFSRECDIYQAYNASMTQALAIKHYKQGTKPQAIKTQFDALNTYQSEMASQTQTFRVPKVFLYDDQNALIIMEWLVGKRLHDHLWRSALRPKRFLAFVANSGKWLGMFHNQSKPFMQDFNTCHLVHMLDKRIEKYNPNAPALKDPLFSEAYEFLKTHCSNLGTIKVPFASLHGDFTPTNLIIQDDQYIGIDLWAKEDLPVYQDFARMCVYLTIAYPTIVETNIFNPNNGLGHSLQKFSNGYKEITRLEIKNDILMLFILTELLRRWLVISDRKSNSFFSKSLIRPYQIGRIKRQIKWFKAAENKQNTSL
jgi:tRNA A-37 threonylcarbamoyl transferase component Bud32